MYTTDFGTVYYDLKGYPVTSHARRIVRSPLHWLVEGRYRIWTVSWGASPSPSNSASAVVACWEEGKLS